MSRCEYFYMECDCQHRCDGCKHKEFYDFWNGMSFKDKIENWNRRVKE